MNPMNQSEQNEVEAFLSRRTGPKDVTWHSLSKRLIRIKSLLDNCTTAPQVDPFDPADLYEYDVVAKKSFAEFKNFLGGLGRSRDFVDFVQVYFDRRPDLENQRENFTTALSHYGCIYVLKKGKVFKTPNTSFFPGFRIFCRPLAILAFLLVLKTVRECLLIYNSPFLTRRATQKLIADLDYA
ncbi:hypothetical protein Fcan01_25443 [Folsomia candida]|uniref:Uncharacterized protein n=1 Tax=Folsomia candida TaxID=158441 RepID=A0A226D2G4_FOLCA|nr:hypothetical protein Fcan01_25443 [Folsomia candida]